MSECMSTPLVSFIYSVWNYKPLKTSRTKVAVYMYCVCMHSILYTKYTTEMTSLHRWLKYGGTYNIYICNVVVFLSFSLSSLLSYFSPSVFGFPLIHTLQSMVLIRIHSLPLLFSLTIISFH